MRGFLLGATLTAMLVHASTATAYEAKPVTIYRAHGDGWGQTISGAQYAIRARYKRVGSSYCVGAILGDDRANSFWVYGTSRWWDKLVCYVQTGPHAAVTFIFDQKSRRVDAYTISRLKHVAV